MKKFINCCAIALSAIVLVSTTSFASEGRGQRMFDQNLKKECGLNGIEVARKHTQAEWKKIYEDNKINAEMKNFCPEANDFKAIYHKDVFEFMYAFAQDSGKVVGAC